jgi:flagellar hook-length control protein FliK
MSSVYDTLKNASSLSLVQGGTENFLQKARGDVMDDSFSKIFADMRPIHDGLHASDTRAAAKPAHTKPSDKTDNDKQNVRAQDDDSEAPATPQRVTKNDNDRTEKTDAVRKHSKRKEESDDREETASTNAASAATPAKEAETKKPAADVDISADTVMADAAPVQDASKKEGTSPTGVPILNAKETQTPQSVEEKTGEQAQSTQNGVKGQADLSFRANLAAHLDAAGSKRKDDAAGLKEKPTDFAAVLADDSAAATPHAAPKPAPTTAEATPVEKVAADDTPSLQEQYQAAVTGQKDGARDEKPKTSSLKENANANASASASSISSPAAGSRAISVTSGSVDPKLTGSPAPASPGLSGGGSPLNAAAKADSASSPLIVANLQTNAPSNAATSALSLLRSNPGTNLSASDQVAVQIYQMGKTKSDRIDMQLFPGDLGRVDVRLDINKEGMVRAMITCDNAQTQDLLQKDSRSLERAFQQAGLQTDNSSLSFNLRGGDAQQQQAYQQNANTTPNAWSRWNNKPSETPMPAAAIQYQIAAGRIDMRV